MSVSTEPPWQRHSPRPTRDSGKRKHFNLKSAHLNVLRMSGNGGEPLPGYHVDDQIQEKHEVGSVKGNAAHSLSSWVAWIYSPHFSILRHSSIQFGEVQPRIFANAHTLQRDIAISP